MGEFIRLHLVGYIGISTNELRRDSVAGTSTIFHKDVINLVTDNIKEYFPSGWPPEIKSIVIIKGTSNVAYCSSDSIDAIEKLLNG